jgi:phosphinothricin acetyltransferase
MSSGVLVRAAEAGDFEAIAALTNVFIRETTIHFGYDPVSADELRASWEAARTRYPWLVAEVDGRFAGYCKAGVWRERAAYGWTPECGVYVEPFVRRQGVGRALYERLIDVMRRQGFHSIVAGVTLPNDASVRLHESVGFVHIGTVRRAGWKLGRWSDVGFWQRELAPEGHVPGPIAPPEACLPAPASG